jgi:hypothetical protein
MNTDSQRDAKTEYRILTCKTYYGNKYLQFKSTKTVRKRVRKWLIFRGLGPSNQEECWRFVPDGGCTSVFGYYLDEESCPTSLPYGGEGRFLSCFHGQEDYQIGGVTPFTKEYPDIKQYFAHLKGKRREHLKKVASVPKDGTVETIETVN